MMLERDYRYITLIKQVKVSPSTALCGYLHLLYGTNRLFCNSCIHRYGFHAYRCCASIGIDLGTVLK